MNAYSVNRIKQWQWNWCMYGVYKNSLRYKIVLFHFFNWQIIIHSWQLNVHKRIRLALTNQRIFRQENIRTLKLYFIFQLFLVEQENSLYEYVRWINCSSRTFFFKFSLLATKCVWASSLIWRQKKKCEKKEENSEGNVKSPRMGIIMGGAGTRATCHIFYDFYVCQYVFVGVQKWSNCWFVY